MIHYAEAFSRFAPDTFFAIASYLFVFIHYNRIGLSKLNKETPTPQSLQKFLSLSQKDKEYLLSVVYQTVDSFFTDTTIESTWPSEFDNNDRRVFVAFWVGSERKGSWSARSNNLAQTVQQATTNTLQDVRYDGQLTSEQVPDLKVFIYIIGDLTPFDAGYEPGIHGGDDTEGIAICV